MRQPPSEPVLVRRLVVGLIMILISTGLALAFFPWDSLRGPINRYVSDQLGRRFEITQHLSVYLGRTITVRADGLEFANPEWASEPYLIKASAAEFEIKLWPLMLGKLDLPRVLLIEPQLGLQIEPDGRRTWALSRDTSDTNAVPRIGSLTIDRGTVKYRALAQGADISAQIALAAQARTPSLTPASAALTVALPLTFTLTGKWKNEVFTANGRTGSVLPLSRDLKESFPLEVNVVAGKTTLKAKGEIENLQELSGLDATFDIRGRNLEELYKLLGIVLPSTPPYQLSGKLDKRGQVWSASRMHGVLGSSDLSGDLSFDRSGPVALLRGKVLSKLLDFEDLRPVIGLPVKSSVAATMTLADSASANNARSGASSRPTRLAQSSRKVLPTTPLDLVRLKAMNADVIYSAADIRHVEQLPLDKGNVHIKLNNGVLQLEPIALGIAGGMLAGRITLDVNVLPVAFDTRLEVRAVQLNQLFPTIQTTKSSFGKISGQLELKGRGNSAAQMLGSATGDVAVLMGKGELSNILLEYVGLDGGEIIKFLLRGDRNVLLRCAAAAFEVKQGLMRSKTIVLDTSDTVVNGSGQISLADETLDITLYPQPKDRSFLSLRSPLKISGTFASPSAGPDKAALAERVGLALALGVINPLLALAATIETGPGRDADCRSVLTLAGNPAKVQPAPRSAVKPGVLRP